MSGDWPHRPANIYRSNIPMELYAAHLDWLGVDTSKPVRSEHSVYFAYCPALRRVKIGTTINVEKRMRAIRYDVGGLEIVLWGVIDGGSMVEHLIHEKFQQYRVSGEWFRDDLIDEAFELIRLDREFYS